MHWLLWLCYFIGQVAHVLKRADLSATSTATQGSFGEWFVRNWKGTSYRMVLDTILFLVWLDPTNYFDRILNAVGAGKLVGIVPVPSTVTPVICATALAFGVLADTGVDYLIARFWPSSMTEQPAK